MPTSESPTAIADTVAFDMDGTLLASRGYVADSVLQALEELRREYPDLPLPSRELITLQLGKRFDEFYRDLLPPNHAALMPRLAQRAGELDLAAIREGRATLFDGALAVLRSLKASGFRLMLISNCGPEYINTVAEAFGLRPLFDLIDCAGSGGVTRSKTEVLRAALAQVGAARTLMVGDRVHDVEAARACSCWFAGASWGYGAKGELTGADWLIDDIRKLPQLPCIRGAVEQSSEA